jgi:nicotinamide riboside kinase
MVAEYARCYLEELDRPYHKEDLLKIARGQLRNEEEFQGSNRPFMFCDTDLRVIKIWSQFKYQEVHPWIQAQIEQRHYDGYLLTNIDLPWQPDPLREHPDKRQQLFDIYLTEVLESGVPFTIISGTSQQRFETAINFVDGLV